MLDDDDVDFVSLAWPSDGGWIGLILFIVIILVMSVIVAGNKDECAQMKCAHGSAVLMKNECLCVEKPVTP